MLVLQREQHVLLAETLREIANVAAGAMVFGQSLADRPLSPWLAVLGAGLWVSLVIVAVLLAGRTRP
jgi:hypothetical protein